MSGKEFTEEIKYLNEKVQEEIDYANNGWQIPGAPSCP